MSGIEALLEANNMHTNSIIKTVKVPLYLMNVVMVLCTGYLWLLNSIPLQTVLLERSIQYHSGNVEAQCLSVCLPCTTTIGVHDSYYGKGASPTMAFAILVHTSAGLCENRHLEKWQWKFKPKNKNMKTLVFFFNRR